MGQLLDGIAGGRGSLVGVLVGGRWRSGEHALVTTVGQAVGLHRRPGLGRQVGRRVGLGRRLGLLVP